MTCSYCEKAIRKNEISFSATFSGYPQKPKMRKCLYCSQRWWCYNDHFELWTTVDDDFTWEVIKRNVDIPIAISKPAAVLPGYGDYTIAADHITEEKESRFPRISFIKNKHEETAVLQWFGKYSREYNILRFQFLFPILADLSPYKNCLDSFHVPFIGKIKDWPDPEQREMLLAQNENNKDKLIIHFISSAAVDHGGDSSSQFSGIVSTVTLADPNIGLITPEEYYNPNANNLAISQFKENQKQ